MSLLSTAYTDCVMYDKRTVSDGEGGYTTEWVEGAPFKAAVTKDSSTIAKIAEAQGVKGIYTVITDKAVNLQFHDVFKRLEDGKIFRVTADGDDKATPSISPLNARAVSAEEWRLTE